MAKYKCTVIVEVDDTLVKRLGYSSVDDYLNECAFTVYDDEGDNICCEVREYEEIANGES